MATTEQVNATIDELDVPTPKELRRIRTDAGLTQHELALAIDSTQTTISQFELGNSDIMASTLRDAVNHIREVADGE